MTDADSVALVDAGDLWDVIPNAGCDEDRTRRNAFAGRQADVESFLGARNAGD